MDSVTIALYEEQAAAYEARRTAFQPELAAAFSSRVVVGRPCVDLGCGPGLYLSLLGQPAVALDASRAMLDLARRRAPGSMPVQADLEALPFRPAGLGGAWASKSYQHLPRAGLPMALAQVHRALVAGAPFSLTVLLGSGETRSTDDFPGRFLGLWEPDVLADVVTGAGFAVTAIWSDAPRLNLTARRADAPPDTVGAGMQLLVCGTVPGVAAGRMGVPHAGPADRWWPALLRGGLVTRDQDPDHALCAHGIGMTDLLKRCSPASASVADWQMGFDRVSRLVAWLRPGAVCLVGLAPWRAVIDRRARPGPQPGAIGGRPAYLAPRTAGAGRADVDELAGHLRAAVALATAG